MRKQDNIESFMLQEEMKKMSLEEQIPAYVIYDIIRSQDPDDMSMDI